MVKNIRDNPQSYELVSYRGNVKSGCIISVSTAAMTHFWAYSVRSVFYNGCSQKILKSQGTLGLNLSGCHSDSEERSDRAGHELVGGQFHTVVFTVWTTWVQKWANAEGLYRNSCGNNRCLNLAQLCETNLTRLIVLCCTEQKQSHYFSAGWIYVQDWSEPNVLNIVCAAIHLLL